jgi:gliding motility-associated-like protein
VCNTCPGLTGFTVTAGFFGLPANADDPLLVSFAETATGLNNQNGGGGLVQICFSSTQNCIPVTLSTTIASCGPYTSNSGVTYAQSGVFTETFVAANGCDSILTINLSIAAAPQASILTVASGCDNASGSATVVVVGGTPQFSYSWSGSNVDSSTVGGLSPGEISVSVTDAAGCVVTATDTIDSTEGPDITVTPEEASIIAGDSLQLNANGAVTYFWSPVSGLSCTNCPNPWASPTQTTLYTVTGLDSSGCIDTAQVKVIVDIRCNELFIPSIFSPNAKGPEANETLCLFSNCVDQMKFVIHNRWGQKVFETEDIGRCWDGTFNGQEVQSGVYAYNLYLRQLDGKVINKTGTISLVK